MRTYNLQTGLRDFGITVIYPCENQLEKVPTDRDPVLEVELELLPGKHCCRGSASFGHHLRVKLRPPC
ncbi:unnamed protein product [Rangifer tarandus platyrhynchus]|uniref:Uncharacterized protein n=2 Tax=Rangifer tarandus platyrhynchus TaxID=3082113 RepID=A0AC59ZMG1_RANTA|nr:unnamed protein product [Rangifer tarandus platyrhynchus]